MIRPNQLLARKGFLIAAGVFLVVVGECVWWWSIHPSWIQFGSVGAHSLSLAWTSRQKSGGCVVMVGTQWPVDTRSLCFKEKARVHLVQLKELQSSNRYITYITVNNLIDPTSVRFVNTRVGEDKPRLPLPLFGNVIYPTKTNSSEALVLVKPVDNDQAYPEMTMANVQGRWAIDGGVFGNKVDQWQIQAIGVNGEKGSLTYSAAGGYMPDLEVSHE